MNSFISPVMTNVNERYRLQLCCKEIKKDGATLILYLEWQDNKMKDDIFNYLMEFKFFNKSENDNHSWVYSKYLCDSYRTGESRAFVVCRNVFLFIDYTMKEIDEALIKCDFLKF